MVSPRQQQKASSPRTQGGLLRTEQRHLSHMAANNMSSIHQAGSSLSHLALKHPSGTVSHGFATMNQTVSYENHSAERPKKLSTTMTAEPDLVREIYRLSELERWPRDKLFRVLADPQAFKKSLRHAKVSALFKSECSEWSSTTLSRTRRRWPRWWPGC